MSCPSLVAFPPGLSSSDSETSTMGRARRRMALACNLACESLEGNCLGQVEKAVNDALVHSNVYAKLESMLKHVQALTDNLHRAPLNVESDVEYRLGRLETLQVCSPSVDEVLDRMLSKQPEPDDVACPEPDMELSLGKQRPQDQKIDVNIVDMVDAGCQWEPLAISTTLVFDLFGDDEEDGKHTRANTRIAGVQTDGSSKKPRRARCNGKATQTEGDGSCEAVTCFDKGVQVDPCSCEKLEGKVRNAEQDQALMEALMVMVNDKCDKKTQRITNAMSSMAKEIDNQIVDIKTDIGKTK